jgi:hypothetical protein
MIQISFDEHALPSQSVLRATANFLSALAGDTAKHTTETLTLKLDADTSEISRKIAEHKHLPPAGALADTPPFVTAGETGAITDAENEPVVGKDADRPNVDPTELFGHAPSTAGVVPSPTVPAISTPVSVPLPPVVPPVPSAVAPPVPATPSSPAGVDTDSAGFPWDERIHAGTKAKIADGTWRQKRGVDPAIVASVEAELRAIMGAPAAAVTPPRAAVLPPVPTPPPVPVANDPLDVPAPPAPPVTIAPPQVSQDPATFPAFVQWVMGYHARKEITQSEINEVIQLLGLPGMPALSMRPDLIPAAVAKIREVVEMVKS